jgi:hypothetical protein
MEVPMVVVVELEVYQPAAAIHKVPVAEVVLFVLFGRVLQEVSQVPV